MFLLLDRVRLLMFYIPTPRMAPRVKPRRGKLHVVIIQAALLIWIVRVQQKLLLIGLGPSISVTVSPSSDSQVAHLGIHRVCHRCPLSSFRRVSTSIRRRNVLIQLLLLLAGDVERNPGPTDNSLTINLSGPADNTPAPVINIQVPSDNTPADNRRRMVDSSPALKDNSSSSGKHLNAQSSEVQDMMLHCRHSPVTQNLS